MAGIAAGGKHGANLRLEVLEGWGLRGNWDCESRRQGDEAMEDNTHLVHFNGAEVTLQAGVRPTVHGGNLADSSLSRAEARRVALAAAGFDKPRPQRVTARDLTRVIQRLGLLQLDFVNVLVPAHYMVLYSRLGAYDRALFRRVAYHSGEFTEQWAREASLVPLSTWPLLRHRRERHRPRPYPFAEHMRQNPEYVEWALQQVRERGPLTAADIVQGKAVKTG